MKKIIFSLLLCLPVFALAQSKNLESWNDYRLEVRTLSGEVQGIQSNIESLMIEEKATVDPVLREELRKTIVDEYRNMRTVMRNLHRVMDEMRFKFPGRGQEQDRYYREQVQSMERIGRELDTDRRLDELMTLMIKQYGEVEAPPLPGQVSRPKANRVTESEKKRVPASEDKPILLSR